MSELGAENPVLVVGAGLSGLATALTCSLAGRPVIVLEAADLVGGAAAYSGGQVWCGANHVADREGIAGDSKALTETYIRDVASHLAPEVLDEQALLRWIDTAPDAMRFFEDNDAIRWTVIPGLADYHNEADGALPQGRYLTNEVIDGSVLGEWRERLRYSPYFPVGTTYAELLGKGRRATYVDDSGDEQDAVKRSHAGLPAFGLSDGTRFDRAADADPLTYGTGVVASFLARVLREASIEIRTEHRVVELVRDGDAVVGLRADTPAGQVELRGPVVLATSTYDWDPDLVEEVLGLSADDWGSVAPETLRGDGIKLARQVGGQLARIPANATPILPGWRSEVGTGFGYGPEYAMPHSMIVDRHGNRYCNDSYWVDICRKTLDPDDSHLPFFLVWDDQHRAKYGLAATPPGGEYPEGWVSSALTLAKLGEQLGIDGEQLTRTAERFSANAARGEDPDFGRGTVDYVNKFAGDPENRPSPVLGPIERAPFHGIRLRFVGTGIGTSGVRIDGDGHVLDEAGAPIDGLYAAGSVAALTTTGTAYNSGIALGRGLTLAYLVGHELSGKSIS
ncbi:MAG TPA: FAD-dependent oxidoreductase [Nocardioides sp.]|uniref:FAD-dependent oxidoreductase n=1 Tax=Nocardioides sp. TaxID=35761 RepID=UPI002C30A236|nr:FAD-dependent oxidoreductase [Nocardioides sp.]HTW18275.1 FAD-dependent oxidoreductase [Nocardioides sp.]